jgi:hypothetical protein
VEREGFLEKERFVVRDRAENTSLFEGEVFGIGQPSRPGQGRLGVEPESIGISVPGGDRLAARGPKGGRILAYLAGEIDQSGDNGDAANEVAEISECLENAELLRFDGKGRRGAAPITLENESSVARNQNEFRPSLREVQTSSV